MAAILLISGRRILQEFGWKQTEGAVNQTVNRWTYIFYILNCMSNIVKISVVFFHCFKIIAQ